MKVPTSKDHHYLSKKLLSFSVLWSLSFPWHIDGSPHSRSQKKKKWNSNSNIGGTGCITSHFCFTAWHSTYHISGAILCVCSMYCWQCTFCNCWHTLLCPRQCHVSCITAILGFLITMHKRFISHLELHKITVRFDLKQENIITN